MTSTQIREEINREVALLPPDEEQEVLSFVRQLRASEMEQSVHPYKLFSHLLKENPRVQENGVEPFNKVETEIHKTEDVNGGAASIGNTRIAVWMLEAARREGISDKDILDMYPQLSAIHLVMAWLYVATHQAEIEREIQENNEA